MQRLDAAIEEALGWLKRMNEEKDDESMSPKDLDQLNTRIYYVMGIVRGLQIAKTMMLDGED